MVARASASLQTEDWDGYWGTDARYYARRGDGAWFAIDAACTIFELASTAPSAAHCAPMTAAPPAAAGTLRLVAAHAAPADAGRPTRLPFVLGVRRRAPQGAHR